MKRVLIICMVLGVLSCAKKSTPNKTAESFESFYTQFHDDPDFQMERIQFPLEGGYIDIEGKTAWSKSDWETHKEKITDINEPDYDTEIIKKEDVVIDKVKLRDSGFYVERKFKLIDGKWYLVYYESVNL